MASETAAEDACKMEHVISDESFAALKQLKKRLCEEDQIKAHNLRKKTGANGLLPSLLLFSL